MNSITPLDYIYILKKKLQLRVACHVADQKQQAFNMRFYVLPDEKGKLRALCNLDIKNLKKAKMMSWKVSHLDVMRECFYYTPASLNDKNTISLEERKIKQERWLKYTRK